MTTPRRLFIDIETYSDVDLPACGLYPYVESDAFEVLLVQYAWNDGPVRVIDLCTALHPISEEAEIRAVFDEMQDVVAGLLDPDTIKIAHNNAFERTCLGKHTGHYLPPEEWEDTSTMAAQNGLPLSLEAAGEALGIEQQKLREGKLLINYFCKPCKPTKSNDYRTRNRPEHAPDKWERFKEYGKRDVEAMQEIYYRLQGLAQPAWERQVEALDARINERGVLVDIELAEAAVAVDEAFKAEHTTEMQRLTGLDNPNSVAQLKNWLAAVGLECESLSKEAVKDIKKKATDGTTKRVLELRQMLGKTSTAKYQAMTQAACKDNRIRGLLKYYGAGRTGRWAGRLVQVQNLPQNHLDDLDSPRDMVRRRDLESLELIYDSVPDVLSQLIRTAFIAKPGHTFLVADYAAIEARVIAYLAGEQWRQDVFKQGGDIYCSSASQMFKVPVEKHGINGHLRQKGKVAELACIAEGQPVLTDVGLVPIEKVEKGMKVWDGIEWVSHEGVVYKGEKEVLTYGGLEATADHVVWATVNGEEKPLRFGDAATCGARLTKTGVGRHPLRVGGNHQPGEKVERIVESLLRPDSLQRLRGGAVATTGQSETGKVKRVPELLTETSGTQMAGPSIYCSQATVHEPERRKLQKLRRPRHRVPLRERHGRLPVYDRDVRPTLARHGAGPDRRQWALRTRQPAVGNASRKLPESAPLPRKVKVYDLLNAGPRHRFTVSNVLVHNCGYGGGVAALKAFGADKMGLTEAEMQSIVDQWRAASPTIPRFWRQAEQAAKRALERPGSRQTIPCCGVTYYRDKDALRCQLPSGRTLSYWGARLEGGKITFMGQAMTKSGGQTKKWQKLDTWGGKLVENIVQAYARDCLAVSLLRLDAAGWRIVFHVHDEVVVEAPEGARWADVAEVMGQPIDWAPGLLLRGDGYETKFYKKD